MTLVDAFVISTRSRDADELKEKDKYVKRFLANQLANHGITAEKLPLEYWNEALNLFGGHSEDSSEKAREALINLLDYSKGGSFDGKEA